MILEIKKDNDPILRQPTEEVKDFDFELQQLIDNMVETMRHNRGVGLAAPQVGVSKKIFVCEFAPEGDSDDYPAFPLTVICNPKITWKSEKQVDMVEGCLSFPGMELLVKRPEAVKIVGQDRYGNPIEIEAGKLYARVIQHENDHLHSTLIVDHLQVTKVLFIGTGSLGVPALKLLIDDPQYDIVGVVTGDTMAKKRNQTIEANQIYKVAKEAKLNIIRTERVNDPHIVAKIKQLKPALGVMADFGQFIGSELLSIPRYGIINIHPSLLPRHRGPSPIQQTILDGDKETGVTLQLTVKEMDAGPILSSVVVELSGSETATILKDYLAKVGAELLLSTIPYYLAGEVTPIAQNHKQATFTRLFTKEDGLVDANTPARTVERKIRAFNEWPKVSRKLKVESRKSGGEIRVQLLAAHLAEDGTLVIDRVKPEGKGEMSYTDYLNGYKQGLTFWE